MIVFYKFVVLQKYSIKAHFRGIINNFINDWLLKKPNIESARDKEKPANKSASAN